MRTFIYAFFGILLFGWFLGAINSGSSTSEKDAANAAEPAGEEAAPFIEEDAEPEPDPEIAEAACRRDIQCWGDDNLLSATFACETLIERMARYDFEWTDGWLEPKFSHFRWHDIDRSTVTFIGDKIKFQNGFGAWQRVAYECDYDPDADQVLDIRIE